MIGNTSYRVGGLDSHWESDQHVMAVDRLNERRRAEEGNPVQGPIDLIIQALTENNKAVLKKLFNTVYFVLKYEEPFTSLPRLLSLQVKNGSDLHKLISYKSDQACRRYTI